MFGFTFIKRLSASVQLTITDYKSSIEGDSYLAFNHMTDKYEDDKVFYEDEQLILILDGVILNKLQLMQSNNSNDWVSLLLTLFQKERKGGTSSDRFWEPFRGSFSGLVYDKCTGELEVFSDHIGKNKIYYAQGAILR